MPNHIDEDARRLEVSKDLLSAESLDPLGKPQSEDTVPKPRVSSGSSSKQKATLPKTSATSKLCAQLDRQHDAVMATSKPTISFSIITRDSDTFYGIGC